MWKTLLTDCYEIVKLQSLDGLNKDCEAHFLHSFCTWAISEFASSEKIFCIYIASVSLPERFFFQEIKGFSDAM